MTAWVIDYYSKISPQILPFLKDRPIGIRQIFDGEMIFRRHQKDGKSFIFINSAVLHSIITFHIAVRSDFN